MHAGWGTASFSSTYREGQCEKINTIYSQSLYKPIKSIKSTNVIESDVYRLLSFKYVTSCTYTVLAIDQAWGQVGYKYIDLGLDFCMFKDWDSIYKVNMQKKNKANI